MSDASAGSGRFCVFCGAADATREHIFRDTYRQYFADIARDRLVMTFRDPHGQERSHERSAFHGQRVKAACRDCNSGWMNDIDHRAERVQVAMMQNLAVEATTADTRALATYLARVLMMRALVDDPPGGIPGRQYRSMYEHRRPPDEWTIAVGRTDRRRLDDRYYKRGLWLDETVAELARPGPVRIPSEDDERAGYALVGQWTAALGSQLCVVVSTSVGEHAENARLSLVDRFCRGQNAPLVKIWPRPRRLSWPCTPAVNDAFSQQISSLVESGARVEGFHYPE